MTKPEAADILDPVTTRKALRPYAFDCDYRKAVMERACAMGAKALRESSWVSVDERLPDKPGEYLVCYGGKKIGVRLFLNGSFRLNYESAESFKTLTYWMPLPEPPKKGGAE